MKVPLLDLQPQYAAIRAEVLTAMERVCDSQQFIMGQEVEHLETELGAAIAVPHAVGVSSATGGTTAEQQEYVVMSIADALR